MTKTKKFQNFKTIANDVYSKPTYKNIQKPADQKIRNRLQRISKIFFAKVFHSYPNSEADYENYCKITA